jgi:hypothetical protein
MTSLTVGLLTHVQSKHQFYFAYQLSNECRLLSIGFRMACGEAGFDKRTTVEASSDFGNVGVSLMAVAVNLL